MAQKKAAKKAPKPTKKAARSTVTKNGAGETEHIRVSAEALPRRTLEQAIEVARALRRVYANQSASIEEVAKATGTTKTSENFRYTLWAAVAYGLVNSEEGPNRSRRYSLAETGPEDRC